MFNNYGVAQPASYVTNGMRNSWNNNPPPQVQGLYDPATASGVPEMVEGNKLAQQQKVQMANSIMQGLLADGMIEGKKGIAEALGKQFKDMGDKAKAIGP